MLPMGLAWCKTNKVFSFENQIVVGDVRGRYVFAQKGVPTRQD